MYSHYHQMITEAWRKALKGSSGIAQTHNLSANPCQPENGEVLPHRGVGGLNGSTTTSDPGTWDVGLDGPTVDPLCTYTPTPQF